MEKCFLGLKWIFHYMRVSISYVSFSRPVMLYTSLKPSNIFCSFMLHVTHVKISQLVDKMCSQQACNKLVNKLQQHCYFIKLQQACHITQLVDKMCSQQACSKLVNKLQQHCYFIKLQQACHIDGTRFCSEISHTRTNQTA